MRDRAWRLPDMTTDTYTDPRPGARAGWRQWLGLVVLLLPVLVLATDLTVLFLAVPSITADLQPGASQALWIVHVYGFLIAGFLIPMGRLGDRVGRRRLLLVGTAAFAVLSVAAAHATSPGMLIAVRALLGVAGATLMPSTFSLLRTMFHHDGQRRFAIAVLFSGFSAGGAIGPLLAGGLLEYFWWGSVFLVNVPVLVLLLAVGPVLLPEHREPGARRLDLPSVGLSVVAMLAIVYGLQSSAEHGVRTPYVLAVAVGVALAVMFVRRQRRLTDPLLDMRLFANRAFHVSVLALLLSGIGVVAAFYLFTQYLQWVLGYTPLQAGLLTVPFVVVDIGGALLAPALVRRVRPAVVMGGGLAVAAGGLALFALFGGDGGLPVALTGMSVAGFGQGAMMALASDTIISTAPADRAGSAAAVQEVSGELGTAVGITFGGAVAMLVYRTRLADAVPAGVPESALDTARDGVAAAATAADGPGGLELMAAAHRAFTDGLQVSVGVGALFLAATAVMVATMLRHHRTADSEATVREQ